MISDPDKALVMPLVIILLAEKADFSLIFALMYILM